MYTVKQVAALTGVAEATLRVWERRYGVVVPARSPSGYRLYAEADVARLRQMAALVEGGVPASHAAGSVLAESPSPVAEGPPGGLPGEDDLVAAAVSLEPSRLEAVIGRAFTSGPFEQVVDGWLLPQLGRLGDAWASGNLSIAHEHFASAGLMRAISGVYEEARGDADGPAVLVGLPAGECHELVLLAFAACLRRRGAGVVYLGADVPAGEWVQAAVSLRARAAVIGVSSPGAVVEAQAVVDRLGAVAPPLSVWVGGSRRAEVTGAHPLPDAVGAAAALLHLSLTSGWT